MRLLVGGDSFAQRPRSNDEFNSALENHWCDLLAAHYQFEVDFVGLGGGDICTTSLRTIQHLIKKPSAYTHCIFFITDWYRDSIATSCLTTDHSYPKISGNNLISFYNEIPMDPTLFGRLSISDKNKYRFIGPFVTDVNNEAHLPHILNYMKMKTDYSYIHNNLSNLSLLSTIANQHNIKLMFVEVFFSRDESLQNDNLFKTVVYNTPVFNYFDLMDTNVGDFYRQPENVQYKSVPSHHGAEQHKEIFNIFNKQYPNWFNRQ